MNRSNLPKRLKIKQLEVEKRKIQSKISGLKAEESIIDLQIILLQKEREGSLSSQREQMKNKEQILSLSDQDFRIILSNLQFLIEVNSQTKPEIASKLIEIQKVLLDKHSLILSRVPEPEKLLPVLLSGSSLK